MTIERRLYQLIMNDRGMQVEIFSTSDTTERVAAIVRMGEQNGLPVDPEIVEGILQRPPAGEMSDAELENVVGGKGSSNDGNDYMEGDLGDDSLDGGAGNDFLQGRVRRRHPDRWQRR